MTPDETTRHRPEYAETNKLFTQVDRRLPGQPRYYNSTRWGNLMLVPDQVRGCVVFVAHKHPLGHRPETGGTAFCVALANPDISWASFYLVTAKHNLEAIQKRTAAKKADGKVYLRYNEGDAGVTFKDTDPSDWYFHPTEPDKVDVAVLPITGPSEMNVLAFLLTKGEIADKELIAAKQIGPGDEIFITGLFLYHPGADKNLPVIRVGTIAGMPEEPVLSKWSKPHGMDAYLIEARSIGGLSGSPVFVNIGPTSETNRREGRFYILGLVHGHWNYPVPDADYLDTFEDDASDNEKWINAGIAMVVPITKILEVIHQPRLAELRRRFVEEEISKKTARIELD